MDDFVLPEGKSYEQAFALARVYCWKTRRCITTLPPAVNRKFSARLGRDVCMRLNGVISTYNARDPSLREPWVYLNLFHPSPLTPDMQSMVVCTTSQGSPEGGFLLTMWPPKDTAYVREHVVARLQAYLALKGG